MITTYPMPERWWKDNGRSCGFGYQADVDEVHSPGGAGWYALKYLLKQLDGATWADGTRRFSTSQNWPALPELEKQKGWKFEPIPPDVSTQYVMREMQESGFEVALLEKGQRLDVMDRWFGEIAIVGEAQNVKR
jgi:hypothetical protein